MLNIYLGSQPWRSLLVLLMVEALRAVLCARILDELCFAGALRHPRACPDRARACAITGGVQRRPSRWQALGMLQHGGRTRRVRATLWRCQQEGSSADNSKDTGYDELDELVKKEKQSLDIEERNQRPRNCVLAILRAKSISPVPGLPSVDNVFEYLLESRESVGEEWNMGMMFYLPEVQVMENESVDEAIGRLLREFGLEKGQAAIYPNLFQIPEYEVVQERSPLILPDNEVHMTTKILEFLRAEAFIVVDYKTESELLLV
uniref:Uncharacterized protein n=1 Tax=Guillardia theta TaxID=55529 RepID=A0A7S4NR19_GUITH|mmetsp:Transcript_28906/g.93171  ORF Transcript_28906/g.93171 Transcript_28906/m.93171 type:complete len:262 (+) Transcript_28906:59-844(+)